MKEQDYKKNKPELPVDWNGHPIQIWTAGGRTIHVSSGEFVAESSVFRVCTGSSVAKLKLKDRYPADKDSGMPIPPNTVLCFGCFPGETFEVEGECDITFVKERDYQKPQEIVFTPSVLSWTPDKTGGGDCTCDIEGNIAKFGGMIDYYFSDPSVGRKVAGNRVGIQIKPSVKLEDFPNLIIKIVEGYEQLTKVYNRDVFDKNENGESVLWYYPLIKQVPYVCLVQLDWTGKGDVVEWFKVEIEADAILKQ